MKTVSKPNTAVGCLMLLALVVAVSVAIGTCSTGSSTGVAIGKEGHLRTDDGTPIRMGASADILNQAARAASANDTIGWRQIMLSSQFVAVPSGTRVLLIGADWSLRNVRVLDGPRSGQAGWVFDYDLAR